MLRHLIAVSALLAVHGSYPAGTGIVAGPKATVNGATFVGQTHDFDGGPGDSLVFVPAADHAEGSMRPIVDQETGGKIGELPQVSHTYAYSYLSYGVMNEHKLAFAQSTCSGRFWAASTAHDGTALFSNEALSNIALERCKTARCAIALMGDLAQNKGGFYGEGADVETGSDTLLLADTTEAWVFHIMADPSGMSAIWAAQKVPDNKFVVVPNTFVIRAMDLQEDLYPTPTDNYMLSSNAKEIATKYGFWNGKGAFDFSAAFSLGEYASPHYASRRMWRAYNLLAPSVTLDPAKVITDTDGAYPFAIKPDKLIDVDDVLRLYRDYYEGTPWSLVKDEVAAGPFNSPLRVAGGDEEAKFKTGAWSRPISMHRSNYAVLSICHPAKFEHGVVWFASHTPHASVFAPAFTSAATEVPRSYVVDKTKSVDRQSLYWASSAVSNWAFGSMFKYAIKDIRTAQQKLEEANFRLADILATAPAATHNALIKEAAERVHAGWWDTFFELMGKYNDGYIIQHNADGSFTSTAMGLPAWWLKAANFNSAVDSPNADFEKQRARMAKAEKLMEKIDSERLHSI